MEVLLPSGIGIAVGMYVNPRFTVPRVIGSVAEQLWLRGDGNSHKRLMVIVASGWCLGRALPPSSMPLPRPSLADCGRVRWYS